MTELELLTAKDVCGLLKINASTLWRWVKAGRFPPPLAIGPHCTRWSRNGVKAWIERGGLGQHAGNNPPAVESDPVQWDATLKRLRANILGDGDAAE